MKNLNYYSNESLSKLIEEAQQIIMNREKTIPRKEIDKIQDAYTAIFEEEFSFKVNVEMKANFTFFDDERHVALDYIDFDDNNVEKEVQKNYKEAIACEVDRRNRKIKEIGRKVELLAERYKVSESYIWNQIS
jgi:hypothetical protein